MLTFPAAKINLGLHVKEKRADSFHTIETLFYPLDFHDVLEIVPSETTSLILSGLKIEGEKENNLCMKAYQLLCEIFDLPPVAIYLHKLIPSGAGLGGGSSDAAHTLKLLDKLFNLRLTAEQLLHYAAMLGSDCPFFLHHEAMLATGRGEILSPFPVNLQGKYIIVVKPPIFVSTAMAYADVIPRQPLVPLSEILKQPIEKWKNILVNDFEDTVFIKYSELAHSKQQLYDAGAFYAAMSGSGAALYGLFEEKTKWQQAKMMLDNVLFFGGL